MKKSHAVIYTLSYFTLIEITMFGMFNHWVIPEFWQTNLYFVIFTGWIPLIPILTEWSDLK